MFGVFSSKKVKVIDHRILSDLGEIDHIIFDKTDTLTRSIIDIKMLATTKQFYSIDSSRISKDLKMVQKDPENFKMRDEKDEKMALDEIDKYSEKSQEFERELDGEFIPEVFEEDKSLLDRLKRSSMQFRELQNKGKKKEKNKQFRKVFRLIVSSSKEKIWVFKVGEDQEQVPSGYRGCDSEHIPD